ncbi:hypothetical protein QUA40_09830 [Microcoleus sp. Pol11C3]|uniref:hypothetical protein n=1 Tax=Microcoleus sp. Pol11C3 TaxID=3055390 RepID=UPI002FD6808D
MRYYALNATVRLITAVSKIYDDRYYFDRITLCRKRPSTLACDRITVSASQSGVDRHHIKLSKIAGQ